MSVDEAFATRIRALLSSRSDVTEKRMFGGICFMVSGHMCCGLTRTDFVVRVGKEQFENALSQPHARPMDFTGRPLLGLLYVAPEGLNTKAKLQKWIFSGLRFVETLPSKASEQPKKPRAHNVRNWDRASEVRCNEGLGTGAPLANEMGLTCPLAGSS